MVSATISPIMGKKLVFLGTDGGAGLACLLALHVVLAGLGPCPYRESMFVSIGHAGHIHTGAASPQRAVAVPLNSAPCPYDLMHAMYGVFRAAPTTQARPTLLAPITFRLNADPRPLHWTLSRSFDPPPRAF